MRKIRYHVVVQEIKVRILSLLGTIADVPRPVDSSPSGNVGNGPVPSDRQTSQTWRQHKTLQTMNSTHPHHHVYESKCALLLRHYSAAGIKNKTGQTCQI
jgi:hypothetical protein